MNASALMLMWTKLVMVGSLSRKISRDWSWSRCFGLLIIAAFLLAALPIFFVSGATTSDAQDIETHSDQLERTNTLSRDAVFMGSATLLGLATFGSLLSLMVGSKHTQNKNLIRFVFVGLAMVIALSTMLMFFACCLDEFNLSVVGIIIVMIGIMAYAIITTFASFMEKYWHKTDSPNNP